MYAVMYYNEEAVFISANDRQELNRKVNEYEDKIFDRFGDVADNFMEERVYSGDIDSFKALKEQDPKFENYVEVDIDDFFRLSKDHQIKVNEITEKHDKIFSDIQKNIETTTRLGVFMSCVLGDYIWDINQQIIEGKSFEIFWYWGSVEEYVKFLTHEIEYARNSIINIFLLYFQNKEDLEGYQTDEMNDISMEYLNTIGSGNICEEVEEEKLDELTVKEVRELNAYLKAANFERIKF